MCLFHLQGGTVELAFYPEDGGKRFARNVCNVAGHIPEESAFVTRCQYRLPTAGTSTGRLQTDPLCTLLSS
jgi:hypothetical protein